MARPIRIERVGGRYHLTARGHERRALYRDPRDRQHFCELLAEMVRQFNVVLLNPVRLGKPGVWGGITAAMGRG